MTRSSTNGLRRRVFRGLALIGAALLPAGAISGAAGLPAQAARCVTTGHVYLTNTYPWAIHYEDQPIDRPTTDYYRPATTFVQFRLGGNGLRPGTYPSWRVERSVNGVFAGAFGFSGRVAGSNCVANETTISVFERTVPGEVWTVTAYYFTGNSLRIVNQPHFRFIFS